MIIIVTGAGRGLGFEIVKKFASKSGSRIVAISRNEQNLMKLRDECEKNFPESNVIPMPFDLTVDSFDMLTYELKKNKISAVDVLINNAGLLINKPFLQLTGDDFNELFQVNVRGAFQLIQSLVPMMKRNSHIVNISSMGGFQGSIKFPGLSLYSASKGALTILTECLAEELKEHAITVNCLAIGAVQTEMLAEAFPGYKAPLNPSEMAAYIFEFAISGHRYYNGKILPVSRSTP